MNGDLGNSLDLRNTAVQMDAKSAYAIPYKEQLRVQLLDMEKRCSKLKELIQLLDENPAIEKFMSLSRQV